MNKQGITLIEIIIVVAIIGVLAAALGISYEGWMSRYKVEQAIKEIHSDLVNTRGTAISRSRYYFVNFAATTYSIIEDANDNMAADDAPLTGYPKTVNYTINENFAGTRLTFDRRGLVSPEGSIWLTSSAGPDYDCISVLGTRINVGKWNGASCDEK